MPTQFSWEQHARAAWKVADRVWGSMGEYHRQRVQRPFGQKMKMGCLAFLIFWVPFVIPFIVYSYIALAAAAVTLYALLVSVPWGAISSSPQGSPPFMTAEHYARNVEIGTLELNPPL